MTDTTSPPASVPVIDAQDPLPEANWLWRRVFVFVCMAVIFGLMIGLAWATNRIVGNVVGRIDNMNAAMVAEIAKQALSAILVMFRLMFWALMVTITYYMIAPSAEQITKMMQTAGLLKAGVQFASRAVETPEKREVAATVGQPPQPVAPPTSEAPTDGGKAPTDGGAGLEGPTTRDFRPVESDLEPEGSRVAPEAEEAPAALPAPSAGLDPAAIVKGV